MLWQKVQFDPVMRQLIGTAQNSLFPQKYWAILKIFTEFIYISATPRTLRNMGMQIFALKISAAPTILMMIAFPENRTSGLR